MAKKKLLKYPKKPKTGASIQVMERYLAKRKEIDKKNAKIKADNTKAEKLRQKISGL